MARSSPCPPPATASAQGAVAHTTPGTPASRLAFVLTALGVFLVSLDVSIANAVLPDIGHSFAGTGKQALAWVITIYAIVFAATLVPGGRLADRAGRRWVFTVGLGIFGAGSAVCGLSLGLPMLLAGRGLQGVGAAAAQPASLGLMLATVPAGDRAHATARWFGAGAVGIGLGPLVGGLASDVLTWRVAFLANLPLILWALWATQRVLPETERHPGRRLPDPAGAVLLACAAAAVTLGISELTNWGPGDARTIAALLAGIALGAWFVQRCRTIEEPLLQIAMLRSPQFAKVTIATLGYSGAFFGLLFSFVLFLTSIWGLSTIEAGLCISVMAALVVPLSRRVGHLPQRVGFGPPLAGGVMLVAIALVLASVIGDGSTFRPSWLAVQVVAGAGIGLCYPLLGAAAVAGLPATELAAATAINQCARQIGAALGVAVSVAALGSSPSARSFHVAWWLCAAMCLVSAAGARTLDRHVHEQEQDA